MRTEETLGELQEVQATDLHLSINSNSGSDLKGLYILYLCVKVGMYYMCL